MIQMTPEQLAFWRALLAPFHPDELSTVPRRGGKGDLTYLDKRALENRLDTVCGPDGWYPEYEATARGYKCRLHVLVPTRSGSWVWMHKEDGAGFEEMGSYNKQTNEWEADVDNDEKSGYTNALRRAAQDAWGIGRYLYRKGIPAWLDPGASPDDALRPQAQPDQIAGRRQHRSDADESPARNVPAPSPATGAVAQPPALAPAEGFAIPTVGKGVYQWCKRMEEHFRTKLVDGMRRGAGERGLDPSKFFAWDQQSVDGICREAIAFIKTLPTYKGEYEHVDATSPAPRKNPDSSAPVSELSDLKKSLWARIVALVETQIGRKPNTAELSAAFGNIAAESQTGSGHLGEIPESLKSLTDVVWIRNMTAFVDEQIKRARTSANDSEGDDIPF